MKLKLVVIDLETPAWLRKLVSIGAPAIAILASGVVLATPKQWTTGQSLTAADLNGLSVITSASGVKYSVGPTHYCGIGPVKTNGAAAYNGKTGYPAMKAMCEASTGCSNSPTAHLCDSAEVARSLALGDPVALGWYTSFADAPYAGASGPVSDCGGWFLNDSADSGPTTGILGPGQPWLATCGNMLNVVCCD